MNPLILRIRRQFSSLPRNQRFLMILAVTGLLLFLSDFDPQPFPEIPPQDTLYKNSTSYIRPTLHPTPVPSTRIPTRAPTEAPHHSSNHASNFPTIHSDSAYAPTKPKPTQPIEPISTSNADLSAKEKEFIAKWCDLESPAADWYPSKDSSWQQRAPYVIFPGAQESHSSYLIQALSQHSQVIPPKKRQAGFFLPKLFQLFHSPKPEAKVKVFAARQRLYAREYSTQPLKNNDQTISIDGSSTYLFHSLEVPHHILCTAPWTKLVVVLRNPVDRVAAHWAYSQQYLGLKLSLEDWIAQELAIMKSVGLEPYPGSIEQEDEAWRRYQNVRETNGAAAIGKSMYVVQLRHWLEAFASASKEGQIHILTTESLQQHANYEYQHLLEFLSLPYEAPSSSFLSRAASKDSSASSTSMSDETRAMLTEFFTPYNRRLKELLSEYGFNDIIHWD